MRSNAAAKASSYSVTSRVSSWPLCLTTVSFLAMTVLFSSSFGQGSWVGFKTSLFRPKEVKCCKSFAVLGPCKGDCRRQLLSLSFFIPLRCVPLNISSQGLVFQLLYTFFSPQLDWLNFEVGLEHFLKQASLALESLIFFFNWLPFLIFFGLGVVTTTYRPRSSRN